MTETGRSRQAWLTNPTVSSNLEAGDTPPFQGCVGLTCLKRLYEGVAGSPVAPFSLCALHGRTPVGESPALSWSLRKK